jgi:folate-binding protein YgfZ
MNNMVQDYCRRIRQAGLWARWDEAPGLGGLLVGGPDAAGFLQSQLTSDVASLGPSGYQMSARVDRKGLLLAWFSLHRLPDRGQPFPVFLLVMSREMVAIVQTDLEKYVMAENVFFEDASEVYDGIVLAGPEADQAEFPDFLQLPSRLTGDAGHLFLWPRDTDSSAPEMMLEKWARDHQWVHLDASPESASVWSSLQLEAGWPAMGRDLDSGSMVLPQTGLERHVVSSTKGCYLGQEVLARIRSYGSVKLALRGLVFLETDSGVDLPPVGEKVMNSDGQSIGSWAHHTYSTVWEAPVALVFLDREHRNPGAILTLSTPAGLVAAKIVMLPFHAGGVPADRARGLHERAVHLFSQGQDLEAANLLEAAIRFDPTHRDSYEALGVILGRGERYHEAIDIFHRLEEVAPEEPMVHTNLSLYYMKIGNREEAERQRALSSAKQFGGNDPEVMRQQEKSAKLARIDDAQRKRAMFAEVLAMEPDDSLALMGMGNALSELGKYDDAEQYLGKAVSEEQNNSTLYLSHGKVLEKLGRNDEAREVLQRGVVVASRRGDLMPLREMEHRLLLLG